MREKKFTLHSVAGYTMEIAIWKMLCDVCRDLTENREKIRNMFCISPGMIQIDGEGFHIIENSIFDEEIKRFYPPEIDKNKIVGIIFVPTSEEEENEKKIVWCL